MAEYHLVAKFDLPAGTAVWGVDAILLPFNQKVQVFFFPSSIAYLKVEIQSPLELPHYWKYCVDPMGLFQVQLGSIVSSAYQ